MLDNVILEVGQMVLRNSILVVHHALRSILLLHLPSHSGWLLCALNIEKHVVIKLVVFTEIDIVIGGYVLGELLLVKMLRVRIYLTNVVWFNKDSLFLIVIIIIIIGNSLLFHC